MLIVCLTECNSSLWMKSGEVIRLYFPNRRSHLVAARVGTKLTGKVPEGAAERVVALRSCAWRRREPAISTSKCFARRKSAPMMAVDVSAMIKLQEKVRPRPMLTNRLIFP